MTEAELKQLEALANAATAGPWTTWAQNDTGTMVGVLAGMYCIAEYLTPETAAFIAAAREAVPALVARVRALEAENERLRQVGAVDDLDRLRPLVAAFRRWEEADSVTAWQAEEAVWQAWDDCLKVASKPCKVEK